MTADKRPERRTELNCGCVIVVCLCGCDANDLLLECAMHKATADLLKVAKAIYADMLRISPDDTQNWLVSDHAHFEALREAIKKAETKTPA